MANRYQQKQPIAKSLLRALPDTRANTRSVGPWVLVATILGSSMAFIDGTAVNVGCPIYGCSARVGCWRERYDPRLCRSLPWVARPARFVCAEKE